MFNLTSAKLTGNAGPTGWTQVSDKNQLFAVVSVDKPELGREILARLEDLYFGRSEKSGYDALKDAVEKTAFEFAQKGDCQIAAACLVGKVVYSAAVGGSKVAIFRNSSLSTILDSEKAGVISASGYPQEDDILVLSTKFFWDTFSIELVKESLSAQDPQSAVETLAPKILSLENSGRLGIVLIRFSGQARSKKFGFFSKATNKVKSFLPKKEIYVTSGQESVEFSQKKKLTTSVGIILLVLLLVSIIFGVRQRSIALLRARYESRLTAAEHDFDESESLSALNPERSRELFLDSRGVVDTLISEKIKDTRIDELKKKLNNAEGTTLGEYKSVPEQFLDLSLLSYGFDGDNLAASNGKAFVLDKKGGKIAAVGLSSKKTGIVAGPDQIQDAKGLAAYEDRAFILTNSGIYEVGELKTKVGEADWTGEPMIYAYSGNLYVLDKTQIWRYQAEGKTFATKEAWLAKGTKVDFSDAKDWTIDGAIYVLGESGRILKFIQGSPQNFSVSGVVPALSTIDAIFSSDETKFIYLLDKVGKRIVVIDKEGKYKAQYLANLVGETKDLAVSERDKKIILLTGSKLYSIEIKHI